MKKNFKLGVIGAGFMSKAIIEGVLKSGFINPSDILVSDISEIALSGLSEKGIKISLSNDFVCENSEFVLLAIKPQTFNSLNLNAIEVEKVISIMAGVNKNTIKQTFINAKVVRCMPNTPISLGYGAVGIDCSDFDNPEDVSFVENIFSPVANVVCVEEKKLSAVTGISGSSPAYFYLFVKSLIEAGVNNGLSGIEAEKLVLATMRGSFEMLFNRGEKTIEQLISAVCSKGGTTLEAMRVFEHNNFSKIVYNAVDACVERAHELEDGVSKEIEIYTDGACSGNPGDGGYCAIIVNGVDEKIVSGFECNTTNNRMELLAAIKGLSELKEATRVRLYSDSQYLVDAFNQGWLANWMRNSWKTSNGGVVKNIDLWNELFELTLKHKITFIKVKGHSNNKYNNMCDKIAVEQYLNH